MESTCNYCGVLHPLRVNAFFSHPVCEHCLIVWRDLIPRDVAELKVLSLKRQMQKQPSADDRVTR